ncbi:hypothetical protein SDC9_205976 [bioreactor metagenome]|uniref:Uncharacterized protein n=1 Tax=bioreactor metagenome TaxID=1076179 RepID=A0A645JF92_9ZZZZ
MGNGDDGLSADIHSGGASGMRNGVRNTHMRFRAAGPQPFIIVNVSLSAFGNGGHSLNRFHWELTGGGFA